MFQTMEENAHSSVEHEHLAISRNEQLLHRAGVLLLEPALRSNLGREVLRIQLGSVTRPMKMIEPVSTSRIK